MFRTIHYGPDEAQQGDLYVPERPRGRVVCLLHGGYWRMPYARDELAAIAAELCGRGYAVWNIEYRRVGAPGGGWPGTLQDVAAAIDHLAVLAADGAALDLQRVVVAGHSSGGHLALWAAARSAAGAGPRGPLQVRPYAAAGLAAVVDLAGIYQANGEDSGIPALLGGTPGQCRERYANASPIQRLPLGLPQLILHGDADEALPVAVTRAYVRAAAAAGDAPDYAELAGCGHMEFQDPGSEAHAVLCRWLERLG